jgi:purine catabolism regulator
VNVTKSLLSLGPRLTLADLISRAGLQPYGTPHPETEPEIQRATPVTGARVINPGESLDPIRSGPPGWIAVLQPHDPKSPPSWGHLVDHLANAGCIALVFSPEVWLQPPPFHLVERAGAHQIALLTIARQTSAAEFVSVIESSLTGPDVATLNQSIRMQTTLLDAVAHPDIEQEIVTRIADELQVGAALITGQRQIRAAAGAVPDLAIAEPLPRTDSTTHQAVIENRWITIDRITDHGDGMWLVIAWPDGESIPIEVLRVTRHAVQSLMRAHLHALLTSRRQEQLHRAQILAEIVDGVTATRMARLREQLRQLHFPTDLHYSLHLIRPVETTADRFDAITNRLQEIGATRRAPLLIGRRSKDVLVVYPTNVQLQDDIVDTITAAHHGVSSELSDLGQAQDGLRQAEISWSTGQRTGQFTPFTDVDFIDFVIGQLPADLYQEKAQSVLAQLSSGTIVVETVVEFLRQAMDIQATARALHLHPNTIRYRLARAEAYLQRPLSDPETITTLFLALRSQILAAPADFPGDSIPDRLPN